MEKVIASTFETIVPRFNLFMQPNIGLGNYLSDKNTPNEHRYLVADKLKRTFTKAKGVSLIISFGINILSFQKHLLSYRSFSANHNHKYQC